MRILIVEDSAIQIEAAITKLVGHELTICRNFRQAERILSGASNGCNYNENASFPFDAILTDLFLPPSPIGTVSCVQHYETDEAVINRDTPKAIEEFGCEIPYGVVIALASLRRKVPVAIISDKSHHGHPINWALDLVTGYKQNLVLGGVKFLVYESCGEWIEVDGHSHTIKQWDKALNMLMG